MAKPQATEGQVVTSLNLQFNDTDHEFVRGNTSKTLRALLTASASLAITDTNLNARALTAVFNITSFPASASTTLALKVQLVDPVSGGFTNLLAATARSATGTTVNRVGLGVSAAAGVSENVPLPRDLRFLVSQSSGATGKDVVWSLGVFYNV